MKALTLQDFKIEIIESFDAWRRFAGAWNELLNNSAANTVFLTWEWLYSWAECYLHGQKRLFIIVLSKNDEPVGIAPWYIHYTKYKLLTMRQIEFLGSPEAGSDYLDVIARRGKEREVADCLYEFLFDKARSRWDCVRLQDIPSQSLFLLHFLNKIESDGKFAEIKHSSFCPFASLSAPGKNYISSLSSNRREQFRRHWRLLKNHGNVEYRTYSGEDFAEALTPFFLLYKDVTPHYEHSLHQFIRKFASYCSNKNWLEIDFLAVDGENIAGLLHLKYNGESGMFLMAVDKAYNPKISIGSVMIGLAIERAFEEGQRRYDFLKGHEPYKFHWADNGRRSLSVFFGQRRLSPLLLTAERLIKNTAKMVLR